jgi:hypothetical protein
MTYHPWAARNTQVTMLSIQQCCTWVSTVLGVAATFSIERKPDGRNLVSISAQGVSVPILDIIAKRAQGGAAGLRSLWAYRTLTTAGL